MSGITESLIGFRGVIRLIGIIVPYFRQYKKWKEQPIKWDHSLKVAEDILKQIECEEWKPEHVIGLGRSGGIWGGWVAGNLGSLPFSVVDDHYKDTPTGRDLDFPNGEQILTQLRNGWSVGKRILVIEGATSTGQTFRQFKSQFQKQLDGLDVKYAVLYKHNVVPDDIDFVGLDGPDIWPDKFPWHFRDCYRPYLKSKKYDGKRKRKGN